MTTVAGAAPLTPRWLHREPPLPPAAVAVSGPATRALLYGATVQLAAGAELRLAHGPGWLLLLGEAGMLPWADGAVYLGWDSGLLLPTTADIWPGAAIVRAGLAALAPGCGLLALLPGRVLASRMPATPLTLGTLYPDGVPWRSDQAGLDAPPVADPPGGAP
jgi:hypothetical protein